MSCGHETGESVWVTFLRPTFDDGEPVSRAAAIVAFAAELDAAAADNPAVTGGTLIYGQEAFSIDLTAGRLVS